MPDEKVDVKQQKKAKKYPYVLALSEKMIIFASAFCKGSQKVENDFKKNQTYIQFLKV
nr:hypothetical protein [Prevotella sp.]